MEIECCCVVCFDHITVPLTDNFCEEQDLHIHTVYKCESVRYSCICSTQPENLRNLEIVLRILRILRLRSNLEIARNTSIVSTVFWCFKHSSTIKVYVME